MAKAKKGTKTDGKEFCYPSKPLPYINYVLSDYVLKL